MNEERIDILADKWFKGTISTAERQELEAWYAAYNNMEQEVNSNLDEEAFGNTLFNVIATRAGIEPARISADMERVAIKTKLWRRIAVAAAAAAAITLGVWLYEIASSRKAPRNDTEMNSAQAGMNDIAPGRNTATLTLADGKTIQLSDTNTGVVINASGIKYNNGNKIEDSSLRGTEAISSRIQTLTASTPRGGTYQVTLPDGTLVWLNADSKISFPSQFIGKERKVVLIGEAYFVVVHNEKQPFRVESPGQVVEDIGTEFNINAYTDEAAVKTTLVEGSASVSSLREGTHETSSGQAKQSHLLLPNQQSTLANGVIKVVPANTEEAIAWKNGNFVFEDESLRSIMRKLSRWYSIEVVYENEIEDSGFTGIVSRQKNISQVLQMLERTKGIHFKIEGRRVTVTR